MSATTARTTATVLPIAPDDGLFLRVAPSARRSHNAARPGERFAAAFRLTWERLPADVRGVLLRYWNRQSQAPRIELGTHRMAHGRGRRLTGVAVCTDCGFTLRFRPEWDACSASSCGPVIAHELRDAYRWATDSIDQDTAAEEAAAWRLASEWGFPLSRGI